MKTIVEKIDSVLARRNPDGIPVKESFAFDEVGDVQKYVRLAMEAVDVQYTKVSKEAGERVCNHLRDVLSNASFQYQGSVMTDTHIKGASDIDLLVICDKFFSWNKKSVENAVATAESRFSSVEYNLLAKALKLKEYKGNVIADLSSMRQDAETVLANIYDVCDFSKGKAITITNQNLNRDVDVVIASWYDDVSSIANNKGLEYRGVQVFNKLTAQREPVDYPFKRAKLLNERSAMTQGRLKKMIRFLKTLKAEAEEDIDFSSFDIYSLCYAMPIDLYANLDYIHLVSALTTYFYGQMSDARLRCKLRSIDGVEQIFSDDKKTESGWKLYSELYDIYNQLKRGEIL